MLASFHTMRLSFCFQCHLQIIGWILGWWEKDFFLSVQVWGVGMAIALLVSLSLSLCLMLKLYTALILSISLSLSLCHGYPSRSSDVETLGSGQERPDALFVIPRAPLRTPYPSPGGRGPPA